MGHNALDGYYKIYNSIKSAYCQKEILFRYYFSLVKIAHKPMQIK